MVMGGANSGRTPDASEIGLFLMRWAAFPSVLSFRA
jgi:hypothetical protein